MTLLLCDPGWCVHKSDVQNKWDDNAHAHYYSNTIIANCRLERFFVKKVVIILYVSLRGLKNKLDSFFVVVVLNTEGYNESKILSIPNVSRQTSPNLQTPSFINVYISWHAVNLRSFTSTGMTCRPRLPSKYQHQTLFLT